jgi:electron transfer flavoprotein beta subunit
VKIAVCIKRVPVMDQRLPVAANGIAIDESGLKFDVNDFDLWAVEAGLQLKEKLGQGEVAIISLGPDAVQEQIRKAISMGADRGVHLKAAAVPPDARVVAKALAAELQGGGYDLILFGRVAVDASNGATGVMVAQILGLPCVTAVSKLEIKDGRGRAQRELEGAQEMVEFPLPAVLTIDEGLNRERLPSLKGIMAAKKKPLTTMSLADAGIDPAQVGLVGAATEVVNFEARPPRQAGQIVKDEGDGGVKAADFLSTQKFI